MPPATLTKTAQLTEAEEIRRGELLATVLCLKIEPGFNPPRYQTDWGTKTALGVYLTSKRIIEDGE